MNTTPETSTPSAVPAVRKARKVSAMVQALAPVNAALGTARDADKAARLCLNASKSAQNAVSRGKAALSLAGLCNEILALPCLAGMPEETRAAIEAAKESASKGNVPSRDARNALEALSIVADTAYRAAHDAARLALRARDAIAQKASEDKAAREARKAAKAETAAKVAELEARNAELEARLAELEAARAAG